MARGGGWQGVVGEGCSVGVKSVRKLPESSAAALAGVLKRAPKTTWKEMNLNVFKLNVLNAAFVCFYISPGIYRLKKQNKSVAQQIVITTIIIITHFLQYKYWTEKR